jgi:TonB family protein
MTDTTPPVSPPLSPSPWQLLVYGLVFGPWLVVLTPFLFLAMASEWRTGAQSAIALALVDLLPLAGGAFFGSLVSSSLVRSITVDAHGIAYRTGGAAYAIPVQDIRSIRYVEGGRGWRYIVVSTGSKLYTIANLAWTDRSFTALKDRIWAWARDAAPTVELPPNDDSRPADNRFQRYIYNEIPRYGLIYLALGAAITALCFRFNLTAPNATNHWSFVAASSPTPAATAIHSSVRLKCTVSTEGYLSNCVVLSENPPGRGFGAAALKLTPRFRMRPAQRDGHPVAATVIIPIVWKLR